MKIDEMVEKAVEYARLAETVSAENRRLLFAQIAQAYAQTAQATMQQEQHKVEMMRHQVWIDNTFGEVPDDPFSLDTVTTEDPAS